MNGWHKRDMKSPSPKNVTFLVGWFERMNEGTALVYGTYFQHLLLHSVSRHHSTLTSHKLKSNCRESEKRMRSRFQNDDFKAKLYFSYLFISYSCG